MKIFLLSFLYVSLYAQTIFIDKNTTDISILQDSYYLIDKSAERDPLRILNDKHTFQRVTNDFINLGYILDDTLWIKFRVKNDSSTPVEKYLVLDEPNVDLVNLYFFTDDGELRVIKSGVFNRKEFDNELAFEFPLVLQAHQEREYFLKIESKTHSLHFSLHIKSYKKFKDDDMFRQMGLSAFFAILFVIFFYNIVIYVNSKEKIFLYHALFLLAMFMQHFSLTGMIFYVIPTAYVVEHAYTPPYYMTAIVFAAIWFVYNFLNLHKYRKILFGFKLIVAYFLVVLVLNSKTNYLLPYLTPAAFLFLLYLEISALYLFLFSEEKYAKYFFYIWSISLMGFLVTVLYYEGVIPYSISFLNETTFTIEVLLFSIVLSDYIKDLKIEKLQKENLLLEQSKMASMGAMLQNIAHQWRQPLAEINAVVMKIDADSYEKKLTQKTLQNDLCSIERLTSHLSTTIDSLTSFSQKNNTIKETSLAEALDRSLEITSSLLKDVDLNITIKEDLKKRCNLNEIVQVILVILKNAVDAFSHNKIKNKKIDITVFQNGERSFLTIEDNAGGIEEKDTTRIFEPYFTTKFKSQGVGIGLYMAKKIMEKYNGDITVENTKNGAKFTITL